MKTKSETALLLKKFVPPLSLDYLDSLIHQHPCHLHISNHRHSKHGDFKVDLRTKKVRISVNGTLNPYAFTITLVHEFAHFVNWKEYGNKVKPHGKEWKSTFREMMIPLLQSRVFPEELEMVLANHMRNPKASSSADIQLMKCLRQFDKDGSILTLDELEDGAHFIFRNREFRRIAKLRKRIKCQEKASGRSYIFSPIAPIERSENKS
jgi:SprT protein